MIILPCVFNVVACVQTGSSVTTHGSKSHSDSGVETSALTHSATPFPTGCDGYRVTGYMNGSTISGTTTDTFCWDKEPEGLRNGCRVTFETDTCPSFVELVATLDWFAPSDDVREGLFRCVQANGIDIDVAEWFDTSRGMHVDARFYASDGRVEAIRAYILYYAPGHQFCCRGDGTGSAGWDPEPLVGVSDCVASIPYEPEDFP